MNCPNKRRVCTKRAGQVDGCLGTPKADCIAYITVY
jgi:hypothetical protein